MINKIFSFFQKRREEPIGSDAEDPQQSPEIIAEPPQPEPLPDVIEIPWNQCARIKNIEMALEKIHKDYKEFLYKNRITEKKTFALIDTFEEASEKAIEELKEVYKIGEGQDYVFVFPEGTGRPGYLKKKESK